jgi:hypothetical protein
VVSDAGEVVSQHAAVTGISDVLASGGISVPNTELEKFRDALEQGELLIMVDIDSGRTDEIEQLVRRHYPAADIGGTEPTKRAFP